MATRPGKRPPPEARTSREEPARLAQPSAAPPARHAALPESVDPIPVGRIVGGWGVRGWVRVSPYNDPRLSLLLSLPVWLLRAAPGSACATLRAIDVQHARPHGAGEIVAKLEGIDDRTAALALEGTEVLLERERFPALPGDEVYWADLIGCAVLDPDGDPLGTVVGIDDHPAHPVMRVSADDDGAHERLIPLVPELIRSVDLAARVVVADWRRDW